MTNYRPIIVIHLLLVVSLSLGACTVASGAGPLSIAPSGAAASQAAASQPKKTLPALTPFPTRPAYSPGELVDYTVQTGDTVPALAAHFNTAGAEIMKANPIIPASATTLPPGMPMKIPIYYVPFWGSPYQILPDSLFIDGPAQIGFNTQDFVNGRPGWLKSYADYYSGDTLSGAEIVDLVALNYSISPRLLLALLEYQAGALTQPNPPVESGDYPLGYVESYHKGVFLQLDWAANRLNNGYYGWRTGRLTAIDLFNGRIERFDPWQNAASASLHNYFAALLPADEYALAISPDGFARTYRSLFGDPWQAVQPHIPGSLEQPALTLPFLPGRIWAFTGGPHTNWGDGDPLSSLDFAPPSNEGGCTTSSEWVVAVTAGKVVRSKSATVVLDLDGDGDERTGWDIFYLHIGDRMVDPGVQVKAGDLIGHPSCEGGHATGTHVHIARKYNGEWIPAGGALAFNLEGWVADYGAEPYLGTLKRFTHTVIACTCSDQGSHIESTVSP